MKFERGPAGNRTRTCRVTDERGYHYTTMAWWREAMFFIYLNYLGAFQEVGSVSAAVALALRRRGGIVCMHYV